MLPPDSGSSEVVAFLDGEESGVVHHFALPKDVRERAGITEQDIARLVGMDITDYKTWETEFQRVDGPTWSLLQILDKEPDAVKRTLLAVS